MMNRIKSLFVSAWVIAVLVGIGRALWQLIHQPTQNEWVFVLVSLVPIITFFGWLFLGNVARTAKVIKIVLGMSAVAIVGMTAKGVRDVEIWFWVAVVGLVGTSLYEWWYSRFSQRNRSHLAVGKALPELEFERLDGSKFRTSYLSKPMLMIFYRGNWCPLCVAQVKEVAGLYQQLATKGVEVMLISSQSHENSSSLAKRFQAPMTFLVDKDNRMAARLGIQAKNGIPAGMEVLGYDSDTVMPTVVMTDASGIIIFADLTDNYRVRPEPDVFLEVFAQAGI